MKPPLLIGTSAQDRSAFSANLRVRTTGAHPPAAWDEPKPIAAADGPQPEGLVLVTSSPGADETVGWSQ